MAKTVKEEINLVEFEMKEETVFMEEELLPFSTVEEPCTVYIQRGEIKVEECELKEEMVSIKEKVITPSTVEDTCTVYVQGEDIKTESAGNQGKAATLAQLPELPSMDDSLNDEGIVLFIKKYF